MEASVRLLHRYEMSATQHTLRRAFTAQAHPAKGVICRSCRAGIVRRHASSSAAAAEAAPAPEINILAEQIPRTAEHIPKAAPAVTQSYQMRAGVVLSRPPQITRDLTPFEKSFFLYQRRLNERLALPFTRYFYFRKDTPADIQYKRRVKERQTPARDIGKYNAYGAEGWNDELLVGAVESEPEHQMQELLKDAEEPTKEEETATSLEQPMPRITEADKLNDQKSLNRLLQRTLYLLVQNQQGRWVFPNDILQGRENLHMAAERVLVQTGGINMNTWVVGNAPIGYYKFDLLKPVVDGPNQVLGEKVFFMKARIMAGQADLATNLFGLKDFKWLSGEELQTHVSPLYWKSVRGMILER
ncbi:hypothetical protein EJ06DRAFT_529927 [Trichodelitschia bisporula]|uniref:Large ribosomal subunit protein mL46 n=1 Tax=Trichodelitschia bisporula TaxID=703511 RepID=A0A6G1HY49_9PEZI|nr:hypothetical protein EJ06DRAFT_529927 [Trichodelitschia bisporula]